MSPREPLLEIALVSVAPLLLRVALHLPAAPYSKGVVATATPQPGIVLAFAVAFLAWGAALWHWHEAYADGWVRLWDRALPARLRKPNRNLHQLWAAAGAVFLIAFGLLCLAGAAYEFITGRTF